MPLASSKWMDGNGPNVDVVISTRVRVARNLDGVPFPHMMNEEQAGRVVQTVERAAERLSADPGLGVLGVVRVNQLPTLDREVLVAKHLISPGLAAEDRPTAVLLRRDEGVSIMVNEEDHLRIQCLLPGFQLEEAWRLCWKIDDALEAELGYAFSEARGYLTACPTNVGTGLRASVMVHVPALVMTDQAGQVGAAIMKLGLTIRGMYGEGSQALGNIFQVSNQVTLGHPEEDIIDNLRVVVGQIIDRERSARHQLLKDHREILEDRVWRALGILTHARRIASHEAYQMLSEVRLGHDLGLLPGIDHSKLNELLVVTRPGWLHKGAGRELEPAERDLRRADLIRGILK
jgi:protein arginine kinase